MPRTARLSAHTALGDPLLPWVVGLTVVAVAVQAREWQAARGARKAHRRLVTVGWCVVSVALAVIAVVVAI